MTFKTGTSGNPRGRKPGVTQRTLTREAIIRKWGTIEAFFDYVVTKAHDEGDTEAMRFLLSRVEAPLKPRSEPVALGLADGEDFTQGVMDAVSRGDLAPDEASYLLNAILAGQKLQKLDDLEAKIDTLLGERNGHY